MGDAAKAVVAGVTGCQSCSGTFSEEGIEWLEEAGDNEGCEEGGEWAALADAFLHEEGAPCAIVPFVVDGACVLIK